MNEFTLRLSPSHGGMVENKGKEIRERHIPRVLFVSQLPLCWNEPSLGTAPAFTWDGLLNVSATSMTTGSLPKYGNEEKDN